MVSKAKKARITLAVNKFVGPLAPARTNNIPIVSRPNTANKTGGIPANNSITKIIIFLICLDKNSVTKRAVKIANGAAIIIANVKTKIVPTINAKAPNWYSPVSLLIIHFVPVKKF